MKETSEQKYLKEIKDFTLQTLQKKYKKDPNELERWTWIYNHEFCCINERLEIEKHLWHIILFIFIKKNVDVGLLREAPSVKYYNDYIPKMRASDQERKLTAEEFDVIKQLINQQSFNIDKIEKIMEVNKNESMDTY